MAGLFLHLQAAPKSFPTGKFAGAGQPRGHGDLDGSHVRVPASFADCIMNS